MKNRIDIEKACDSILEQAFPNKNELEWFLERYKGDRYVLARDVLDPSKEASYTPEVREIDV